MHIATETHDEIKQQMRTLSGAHELNVYSGQRLPNSIPIAEKEAELWISSEAHKQLKLDIQIRSLRAAMPPRKQIKTPNKHC